MEGVFFSINYFVVFSSLGAIVVLYFLFALLQNRICAICTAVSITWAGLLLMYFFKLHENVLWMGILMGGSVVGLMYKLEKYFQKNSLQNFWLVRILVIVFGFTGVYWILVQNWRFFLLTSIVGGIAMGMSLFFTTPRKHDHQVCPPHKGLRERLEHCCD